VVERALDVGAAVVGDRLWVLGSPMGVAPRSSRTVAARPSPSCRRATRRRRDPWCPPTRSQSGHRGRQALIGRSRRTGAPTGGGVTHQLVDGEGRLGCPDVVGVLDQLCQSLHRIVAEVTGTVCSSPEGGPDAPGQAMQSVDECANASVGSSLVLRQKRQRRRRLGVVISDQVRRVSSLVGSVDAWRQFARHASAPFFEG